MEVHMVLVTEGNRVRRFAGCKRFMGTYELKEGQLQFRPLASTRMACMEGMEQEQRFLDACLVRRPLFLQLDLQLPVLNLNVVHAIGERLPEPLVGPKFRDQIDVLQVTQPGIGKRHAP